MVEELKQLMRERLYRHYRVSRMTGKAGRVLERLFETYMGEPRQMPGHVLRRIEVDGEALARVVAEYMGGMTDRFALDEYLNIFDADERVIEPSNGFERRGVAGARLHGAYRHPARRSYRRRLGFIFSNPARRQTKKPIGGANILARESESSRLKSAPSGSKSKPAGDASPTKRRGWRKPARGCGARARRATRWRISMRRSRWTRSM